MMEGDHQVLSHMKLGSQVTVAEFLKEMSRAPPLAILQLCHGNKGYYISEHLLQHADDLDFVQDTLITSWSSLELNPILH